MKKIGWLVGSTVGLWAVLVYPAWLLWGDVVWLQSLAALGLCLVPALVVLAWLVHAGGAPETQVIAVLGGTGLRMFATLGGGLVLTTTLPELFTNLFWAWIAVFYLYILAVETLLVLKRNSPQAS